MRPLSSLSNLEKKKSKIPSEAAKVWTAALLPLGLPMGSVRPSLTFPGRQKLGALKYFALSRACATLQKWHEENHCFALNSSFLAILGG